MGLSLLSTLYYENIHIPQNCQINRSGRRRPMLEGDEVYADGYIYTAGVLKSAHCVDIKIYIA